jgi:hypothetical protein
MVDLVSLLVAALQLPPAERDDSSVGIERLVDTFRTTEDQ